ncbi:MULTISPECIES: LUD domain-containing protein [unclassified Paenibacillus]|uniref:LutC/YkgG family protein n=1 Tax=unclassified Paenibacillus TaxID=185978 RepID=UPI0009568D91|nr:MULTISPECIES: LUD domain-containing protein [unclassified Paenibacillus]ASS65458.1 lactate utilization protein C [Paenibacillus sp. RUD330]SIQ35558.1 L-lactate dehydrogenase complex protein LldG [Paenibacillus sp. RU4X]SIQ57472.1 L-lactate dehydrogenase complex protein LldG [Paenibacillus sp. RU4T]
MAETHKQLLERLEMQSRRKQEKFFGMIAGRMGRGRLTEPPEHPYKGAPDFWNGLEWTAQEKIERFVSQFISVGGHAAYVSTEAEAGAYIAAKAMEMKARTLLRQNQPGLDRLSLEARLPHTDIQVWNSREREDWKAVAAAADFGVVEADYGAAYTGSVIVLSDGGKGRSVSLLPAVLIVLMPLSRLFTRMGEVLEKVATGGREGMPAGMHFISGPSRSADIENDLTIGVHGPGIVHVLICGDR